MGDASNAIMNLRPVTFYFNEIPDKLQYGHIAEEVNDIMPDLVYKDEKGQIETVLYHVEIPMILNELQKAVKRIAALEYYNQQLINRIDNLEKR